MASAPFNCPTSSLKFSCTPSPIFSLPSHPPLPDPACGRDRIAETHRSVTISLGSAVTPLLSMPPSSSNYPCLVVRKLKLFPVSDRESAVLRSPEGPHGTGQYRSDTVRNRERKGRKKKRDATVSPCVADNEKHRVLSTLTRAACPTPDAQTLTEFHLGIDNQTYIYIDLYIIG